MRASVPSQCRLISSALRFSILLSIAGCSESAAPSADPPVFTQQGKKLVGTGVVGAREQGNRYPSPPTATPQSSGAPGQLECWGRVGVDSKRWRVDPARDQAGRQ